MAKVKGKRKYTKRALPAVASHDLVLAGDVPEVQTAGPVDHKRTVKLVITPEGSRVILAVGDFSLDYSL